MPKRFERHTRSRTEWDAPGSRRDELVRAVSDDPAAKSPGKKNPARCKGNQGGPHVPVISLRNEAPQDQHGGRCRWGPIWSRKEDKLVLAWYCVHEIRCTHCGRIFERRVSNEDCPAYPGDPGQRAGAGRELRERNEEIRASPKWRWRRKPPVTGPQGFRRKKSA